ncbi:GNAT family N-acetyltransferase [Actinoplanes oblitus]|uniref:GNAT family N-acetyltransferase n=1 Tax=Actinoplanes oblitus TaxID=3040509 RepID=UPI002E232E97
MLADIRRHGYERFEWWVLAWNEPAIGFYRALGAELLDDWTGVPAQRWRPQGSCPPGVRRRRTGSRHDGRPRRRRGANVLPQALIRAASKSMKSVWGLGRAVGM